MRWSRFAAVDWYARGAAFVAAYPDHIPSPREFADTIMWVYGEELGALTAAERREAGLRLANGFEVAWKAQAATLLQVDTWPGASTCASCSTSRRTS